jgi:hypothetical protein
MGVLEKAPRPGQIRLQDDRDHSPKGAHLAFGELVLRMLLETGIINLLHLWFILEKARNLHGILAMPFHAQRESLQAAQGEKAVERPGNRANRVLQKCNLIAEFLVLPDDDHATDHIGVPIQIFRRGMNDHVEAKFDRPLHPRTGESVVGNADRLVRARDFRDRFQVDQLQERIARGLHPDHARIGAHRLLDRCRIGHIDEGEIEVRRAATHPLEQAERAAVEVITHHDVRTAIQSVKGRGHRREA